MRFQTPICHANPARSWSVSLVCSFPHALEKRAAPSCTQKRSAVGPLLPTIDLATPLSHPVPNRIETKSQAPREEMLPLLMIGMVESTLDIA